MPRTTAYNFGDVVLVPFPFTDQLGTKKRPAVVVSSHVYNTGRPDLVVMAVTGQIRKFTGVGEIPIAEWQQAGLLKTSIIKPVLTTIEKGLVLRRLGRLGHTDRKGLQDILRVILG